MADINITVSGLPNTGKSVIIAELVSHLKKLGVDVTFQDQSGEDCIAHQIESPEHREYCLEQLLSRNITVYLRETTTMRPLEPLPDERPDWDLLC